MYIDREADLDKALAIAYSKRAISAACNPAAETLLVHQPIAARFLPQMIARFRTAGVAV